MHKQTECPICGSKLLSEFLSRKQVPINQNLLMSDQASALGVSRGALALAVCEDCGFIFNRAFDPQKLVYGQDYENTQACSPLFNEYMDGLVRRIVVERNVRDSSILEIGCGKGLFLRKLVSYERAGNRGYGIDPSYTGPPSELDGRLHFAARYFDSKSIDIPVDVVICRHVLEHVPRPLDLLRDVKKLLARARAPRIFFETPCVDWILRNQVIWDFFYEHCSHFTAQSLTTAFEIAGFKVESLMPVFAGQYLWLEASLPRTAPPVSKQPRGIVALAKAFTGAELGLKRSWEQRIQSLATTEKVALWGAGAKGVTFANLIDPERRWIDSVVDLNPLKQDHFVPGTGHPIVSHTDLAARGVTSAILMNPYYREENLALLKAAKTEVRLIEKL